MGKLGWARCLDNVADILRRGAWYAVVEETGDGRLVVSVRDQRVRLSRHDVRMRPDAPTDWSIVARAHVRSEEHTSELQSQSNLVCRLLLGKKKNQHDYLTDTRHSAYPTSRCSRATHPC